MEVVEVTRWHSHLRYCSTEVQYTSQITMIPDSDGECILRGTWSIIYFISQNPRGGGGGMYKYMRGVIRLRVWVGPTHVRQHVLSHVALTCGIY